MARIFHCSLVTPEKAVFEGEVSYANVPAHDGQLGIMPNRAPMLMEIGQGLLRLTLADGSLERYRLEGGFVQMDENRLTLLSERAEKASGGRAGGAGEAA